MAPTSFRSPDKGRRSLCGDLGFLAFLSAYTRPHSNSGELHNISCLLSVELQVFKNGLYICCVSECAAGFPRERNQSITAEAE